MLKRFELLQRFFFKKDDEFWLKDPWYKEQLRARGCNNKRILYTFTPTLDEYGAYKGEAIVNAYGITPTPPRSIPSVSA